VSEIPSHRAAALRRFGRTAAVLLAAWLAAATMGLAAGVAVIKEQPYHRDSSARAVAYQRLIDSHGPWLRVVTRSGNIDIGRSKLFDWMEVDESVPPTLLEEQDIVSLRHTVRDLRAFADRYPQSRPLLDAPIGALAGHLARFDNGEVRFEGEWISRRQLAAIHEERRAGQAAARLREIERLAFESAQRDKGLVEWNGSWVPAAEVPPTAPSARTDLSDALAPLLTPDIESARPTLRNLTLLASSQTGATKVRTERLHTAIHNLFTAEFRLSRGEVTATARHVEAAAHDRRAREWLKPNAFGTQRRDAARASHAMAMQIRHQAARELDAHRSELLASLEQADGLAEDFHRLGEHRVALTLGDAVRRVADRNFQNGEFKPAFADATLESIRRQLVWNRAAPEP
jgi:hypothetical protein